LTRTISTLFSFALLATFVAVADAQTGPDELIKRALAASPAVSAKRLQLESAKRTARALAAPASLELELAPGVGFTNSNFALGQSIDFSGVRAARALRARSEVAIAEAELIAAQADVAARVLTSYSEVLAAREETTSAKLGLESAEATLSAIKKRVEIGEAPAVNVIRAEVEVQRARQQTLISDAELKNSRATLASLLGELPDSESPLNAAWPSVDSVEELAQNYLSRMPRAKVAQATVEAGRAAELEARRRNLPSVFAGLTADSWSLDRRPTVRDNFGLQLRIAFPIDLGEQRHTVKAAQSVRGAREAEHKEVVRQLELELLIAQTSLATAKSVAEGYTTGIVPKAEQMVRAMQAGLESGLTSLIEVLEAQRALIQLRREATVAAKNVRLAEVRLRAATTRFPGLEMS
jgi:outer membrane protein TolC